MGTSWGTSWWGARPGFPLPFLDPLEAGHMVPLPSEHRQAWLWRTLVLATEGPGRDLPLWQSWRQPPAVQENTLSLWHLFQCLPYLETLMYSLNTLGQLFFP